MQRMFFRLVSTCKYASLRLYHIFRCPEVGGQGIASGFPDASSLAWRLALACQENTTNYENLLSGWYRERKQQLERSLATTVENGKLCPEANTWKFFFLKLALRIIQLVPPGNDG
jgi:2-polyprenyl-6-methoxyphenol hydroxylase-like FAD-dependent oxidoreductase